MVIKSLVGAVALILLGTSLGLGQSQSFLEQQLANTTVNEAFRNQDTLLREQFQDKDLIYPPRYVYIRAFKYDSQLEVWVKQNLADTFRLFKTYRICALSGTMGPKRKEGDRQVPEGFYYISEFRPNSAYHLALGLNYPNYADRVIAGGAAAAGGDIYIHGSCVTEGCIPLTDPHIEEVYLLAAYARNNGQEFIPVHIFPVRFDQKSSMDYLGSVTRPENLPPKFWANLENAYDYFDSTHQLPVILYDSKGHYVMQGGAISAPALSAR